LYWYIELVLVPAGLYSIIFKFLCFFFLRGNSLYPFSHRVIIFSCPFLYFYFLCGNSLYPVFYNNFLLFFLLQIFTNSYRAQRFLLFQGKRGRKRGRGVHVCDDDILFPMPVGYSLDLRFNSATTQKVNTQFQTSSLKVFKPVFWYVFGPPGSRSVIYFYGSGSSSRSGSFHQQAKK
jgi:hypothetical protein